MGSITNIEIIVEDRFQIDYKLAEDLNIKFNRVVEDFNDLSKRFGEFSYTFSLPKSKNNSQAFEFANVKGSRGIFVGTQKNCRVYNNNKLLLDGIIELRGVTDNSFQCAFFSKFTQLLDDIGSNKLTDILSLKPIANFTYEPDYISHVNSNLKQDDTIYQFPFTFYSTWFTPDSSLVGASVDFKGNTFNTPDREYQNYYYCFSSDNATNTNQFYIHQYPMSIYIVSVLEAMLEDVGWSLGGSFFQRDDIKQITMLYAGSSDVYDQAIGCPDDQLLTCTGLTNNIWTAIFLPKMKQTDFLKGLLNMFNLYFTLDIDNKLIKFETWDVLFSDKYNPYDVTDLLNKDTVNFSRIDNFDPSISFKDAGNMDVLGDNKVMTSNNNEATSVTYEDSEVEYTSQVFNKIGTTGEIKIPFGVPNIGRKYLRQDLDLNGTDKNGNDFQVFLPLLTKQDINDNKGKNFNKATGDTFVFNNEATMDLKSVPTLMWYYGQSNSDQQKIGGTLNSQFYYNKIGTGARTKWGFANPFTLLQGTELTNINTYLASSPNAKSKTTAELSYLKGLHYNIGKIAGDVTDVPPFSLTFGDDDTYHRTLYTEFHKNKYDLYFNSELLTATMRMSEFSWGEMQINRPILYNDELYAIIAIENYDVVNRTAEITLIKK